MEAAVAWRRQRADTRRKGVSRTQRREELELLRRYAATRSPAGREQIVARFMPLARSLAMRYAGGGEPVEDLVQVANLALVKAVDGFDPDRGRPFAVYAVPTIVGELRRHFRDYVSRIHLPRSLQESVLKVDRAIPRLTGQLGRAPTVTEIAGAAELDADEVLEALDAADARRVGSLDASIGRDDAEPTSTIETVGRVDGGYDRVEADTASKTAELDQRERLVLKLRFGRGLTQSAIGEMLGVSQMQVSRISRRALRKLLHAIRGGEDVALAGQS